MSESFELPSVDSITFGTVGEPGQRVFYVQARSGATMVTIKAEKQQVSGLAAALRALLADLPPLPDVLTITAPELVEPVEAPWAIGGIGLSAFEEVTQRVTLLLEELVPEEEAAEAASARFGLTMPQMRALAERAEVLVAGGRPPCPLCGNPMNPDGHACPKTNGHLSH
ncbi:MAG: hypothetical protein QOF60_1159 [Actinomycetota bacterium]|jgi:uncharacterized repeat protein (TIGR03847 family)|nr:hypothetical protein [Actinomycetota bacterium]